MQTSSSRSGRPPSVQVHGAVVRDYRERAGLQREALSDLLGVTTRTLQRVENEGQVGMSLLRQLCDVLRMPLVAVLRQDAEEVRRSLRAFGFAPGQPPALVGRRRAVAELADRLTAGPRLVLGIIGPIGVGKTSLAQQIAQDLAAYFDGGVVWVHGQLGEVRATQIDIARALRFDAHLPPLTTRAGRDWGQAFTSHLWTARRLLVLDDVVATETVEAFLGDRPEGLCVLFTTRFRHVVEETHAVGFELKGLVREDIAEIISSGLDPAQVADREGFERVLDLVEGRPGLANLIHTALRRERLSTASSWLARFERGLGRGDRLIESALGFYDGLSSQISPGAWRLFEVLGLFRSEPVPVSWLAAAEGLTPDDARAALSELLDAQVVSLDQAGDEASPEPWLRLATHAAVAARARLGPRLDQALAQTTAHAIAAALAARADSPPAMVRHVRRHRALYTLLRDELAQGLGTPPDLAHLTGPDPGATPRISPQRAELLVDLVASIAPALFDHTITHSGDWFGLALLAAPSLEDPRRRGLTFLQCGWWRIINVAMVGQSGWDAAARHEFERCDDAIGLASLHALLTMIYICVGGVDAAPSLLAAADALDRFAPPGVPRAALYVSLARSVMGSLPSERPAQAAAALCERALADLDASPPSPLCRAVATMNLETYRRLDGADNAPALRDTIIALRTQLWEPWLCAALVAHAVVLGAPLAGESAEEALRRARGELWECTRTCPEEWAPRLLWFVATCGLYELTRRAAGDQFPMVRGGVAGHGVPSCKGLQPILPLCGNDLLVMLSTEATGALLDLPYIDLALDLAAHVTDGRLVSPALRQLRDGLAQSARS